MEKKRDITDESVLTTIKKFSNVMINRYFKLYPGIDTDFKFDIELVDLFDGERQWDYEDDFRRHYDYVLELIPDKPFPWVVFINNDDGNYNGLYNYPVEKIYKDGHPYIWVANIQTMLKMDLRMLGPNFTNSKFAIQIKNLDKSLYLNEPQD